MTHDRLVTFPEIASWQTSTGEVVPVYEDYNGRGTEYRLAGFWNVQKEQAVYVRAGRGVCKGGGEFHGGYGTGRTYKGEPSYVSETKRGIYTGQINNSVVKRHR